MRTLYTDEITSLTQNEADWVYNGKDCCITFELFREINPILDDNQRGTYKIEMDLMGPILDMALRGCLISEPNRIKAREEIGELLEKLRKQFKRLCIEGLGLPKEVNFNSPKQMQDLLYGFFQLPEKKKRNQKGQMVLTTNRDTLEEFAAKYIYTAPVIFYILALRDMKKQYSLLSTKLDADNRIRATYNIAGTNTGRLSSSVSAMDTGTNLQNIDKRVKYILVPDKGKRMANVDLEQADSRNLGAILWNLFIDMPLKEVTRLARAAGMIKATEQWTGPIGEKLAGAYLDACESGDLHTTVCRMAWTDLDWPEDNTKWRAVADLICYRNMSYRDMAKRLGHGTNFRGTPRTMAGHTKVPTKQITEFQQNYFRAFPAIPLWHQWIAEQLEAKGTLVNLWGRQRRFFGRANNNQVLNQATAFGPQSSTADEINLGMINLWRNVPEAEILLQVHDSLTFQYPPEIEAELIPRALAEIEVELTLAHGRKFSVPVDCTVGWNWGDQKRDKTGKVIKNPNGQIGWKIGLVDDRPVPVEQYDLQPVRKILEERAAKLWASN